MCNYRNANECQSTIQGKQSFIVVLLKQMTHGSKKNPLSYTNTTLIQKLKVYIFTQTDIHIILTSTHHLLKEDVNIYRRLVWHLSAALCETKNKLFLLQPHKYMVFNFIFKSSSFRSSYL